MVIPAVPVIIILLGCGAYLRRDKEKGVMTPERTKIFNAALAGGMQDPDNLDKLAATFAGQGLKEQAELLRRRATLKRLPNEIKLARRNVWRKAIKSKNKSAMQRLAAAYDHEGCTCAAMRLREIASGIPDQLTAPQAQMSGETPETSEAQPEETDREGDGEDASVDAGEETREAAE